MEKIFEVLDLAEMNKKVIRMVKGGIKIIRLEQYSAPRQLSNALISFYF